MRRAPQPIHYRRPESTIRDLFCNDKIDIVHRVELAQITKKIRRGFTKILVLA
jgi:hypothetical protein